MAYVSPTFNTTNANVKYRVVATIVNTNQISNYDEVNVQIQAWRTVYYAGGTYGSGSANVKIDNVQQVAQAIVPSQVIGLNSYTVLFNANYIIYHNTDGSKRLNIGGYFTINSPVSSNPSWQHYEFDLPLIPRESTITVLDANIEASTLITINKNIPDSTTTLKYSFGTLNGTIVEKTPNLSYGWVVPSSFYAEIPNAINGVCTITAETYSGTTLIGTKTATFVATVSSANAPDVEASIVDNNAVSLALTGNNKKILKGVSNALFSITATPKNSATITERKITCGSKISTSASGTLSAVESNVFTVFTKDSRGLTKTVVYQAPEFTLIPYEPLTLDPVIKRTSPTGDTLSYTISGNYFNDTFGAVANSLKVEYRVSEDGGLTWLDGGTNSGWKEITGITPVGNTYTKSGVLSRTGGYDFELQAKVELRATDKIRTISDPVLKNVIVDKGRPAINYGDDYVNINEALTVGALSVNGLSILSELITATKGMNLSAPIEPMKIRYIRDYVNGNSVNTGNHWNEVRALTSGGTNRALGRPVTSSGTIYNSSYATNGDLTVSQYTDVSGSGLQYIQIDLGAVYTDIVEIKSWHYWADIRWYNGHKIEVSEDGITWIKIYDVAITGVRTETSDGISVRVPQTKPLLLSGGGAFKVEYVGYHNGSDILINGCPLIQSGSNGLGQWIRFYDGTQICTGARICTGTGNGSTGTIIGMPNVFSTNDYTSHIQIRGIASSGVSGSYVGECYSNARATILGKILLHTPTTIVNPGDAWCHFTAIGRWY